MQPFPDSLRIQVSKNKQASDILTKLDLNDDAKTMWSFLLKVFTDESCSIMEKLSKLVDQNDDTSKIKESYENSLKSFKEDFLSLLELTVEQVLKTTLATADFKSVQSDQNKIPDTAPPQVEKEKIEARISVPIINLEKHNVEISPRQTHMNASVPVKIEHRSHSIQYRLPNLDLIPKIDKKLYERLTAKHTKRRSNHDDSFDNSINFPQLNNSAMSKGSKNGYLYLQSEFNNIKGAASFGQSKREFLPRRSKAEAPGPGDYSMDTTASPLFKKSPNPIIGRANRITWIDTASKNDSPGPGMLYPSKRLVMRPGSLY